MIGSSFITTIRDDGASRRSNLAFLLQWYRGIPGMELIVVEQDSRPRIASAISSPEVKHILVANPGPFNKGWGMNVGARSASGPVLIFCDADILLDTDRLQSSIRLCSKRVSAVDPYDRLVDLSANQTKAILEQGGTADFDNPAASHFRNKRQERICFCGGAFLVRNGLFRLVGGFDERYIGWGGDDDAMSLKLQRSTSDVARIEARSALHLWHPREESRTFGDPHYELNLSLLQETAHLPEANFQFMCELQRQVMGNPNKYE